MANKESYRSSELIINQSLHGYKNGHSLIATSFNFSIESKKLIQVLSDLSGPVTIDGFDSYVTGYPLSDANQYVIAKTWYAEEMKRPGCVWTHSLLIDFEDLAKIKDPIFLFNLFKRPSQSEYEDYSVPILADIHLDNVYKTDFDIDIKLIRKILYGLYSLPFKSIIVFDESNFGYDYLLLKIWMQQWLELRQCFTFSSGSLSNRAIDNDFFDLQVSPEINYRKFIGIEKCLIANDITEQINDKQWLDKLVFDLEYETNLKNFISSFSKSVNPSRWNFYIISNSYILYQEGQVTEFINLVGSNFASPEQALDLKLLLFSKNSNFDRKLILKEISVTEFEDAFTDEIFISILYDFVLEYWRKNEDDFLKFLSDLIRYDLNIIGEKIFEKVAKLINQKNVKYLTNFTELLQVLAYKNNKIATLNAIWRINTQTQNEILEEILGNDIDDETWTLIINSIIDANAFHLIPKLIDSKNEITTNIILERLNNENILDVYSENLFSLSFHQDNILRWLSNKGEISVEVKHFVANVLNPNSREVYDELDLWLRFILTRNDKLHDPLSFKVFMLGIAYNNNNIKILKIFIYAFEDVYEAQLHDELEYSNWNSFEIHARSLKKINKWDKCKILRRALLDKFIDNNWPLSNIELIFTSDKIYNQIMEDLENSKFYRKLLKLFFN